MAGQVKVFNIQRYSVHDGDGIRTSIFFKGCPLSCLWCHNPESQSFVPELLLYHDRCTVCGECVKRCPSGVNALSLVAVQDTQPELCVDRSKCVACGVCTDWCVNNAREIAGRDYTVKELVREAEQDRMFYEQSGGGVTLSGGEVMVQDMDFIEQLCRILYNKGYSVNIDTCGHAPYENFKRILPYIDTFLYDIKLMDTELHKKYTGVSNALILENLEKLSRDGARINIRIPTIGGINDTDEFFNQVIDFLKSREINVAQVNLLPYHDTGRHKYTKLDREYNNQQPMSKPSQERMEHFREIFTGTAIKIGG